MADRLRSDSREVMSKAMGNILRWKSQRGATASDADIRVWEEMIRAQNLSELHTMLVSEDERSKRLRQSSPFAGVLDAREVWMIKRGHETT